MIRLLILAVVYVFSISGFSQKFEPNELLIQINEPSSIRNVLSDIEQISEAEILEVKNISKIMHIYQIKFDDYAELNQLLLKVNQINHVVAVQKNHLVLDRITIPNDTIFGNQWHLNNTGQTGGVVDADIDAVEAWDITTGGNTALADTIVVCIIESSGVNINHPDLIANIWKNHAEIPNNNIDDDNNGYIDDFEGWNIQSNNDVITPGSHGTRVASMIGSVGNNTTGVSGVNHHVKMMIVQGQQASNEASVIAAYSYPLTMRKMYNQSNGVNGAFVVATNASWGINNGNPANSPLWCSIYDSLGHYGILNIGATSNSNVNVDVVGDLPTTCPSNYLIGVTMSNSADQRANSGFGPIHVDLAAPGHSVLLANSTSSYSTSNGTSFATPCVAGAVALLYASPCANFVSYAKTYPDSAAINVRNFLLDNVDILGQLNGDVATSGRLNINNSIIALMNTCDTNLCITPYGLNSHSITDTSVILDWYGYNNSGFIINLSDASGVIQSIPTGINPTYHFTNLTPCSQYTINIIGLCNGDSSPLSPTYSFQTDGCCQTPDLLLGSKTKTQINLTWNSILYATKYVVKHKTVNSSNWIYDTVLTTNFSHVNLDTCTEYNYAIKTICADSSRLFGPIKTIITLGCGICYEGMYCDISPNTTNTSFEWLETVILNNFTSTTGNNNGYYAGQIFTTGLHPGQSYTITFIPGYTNASFTEHYSVWIDIDQNGVFDPSDKLINNLTSLGATTGLLSIPNTTISGITKMRIAMNGVNSPSLCADESGIKYGEYEDYCILIDKNASIEHYSNKIKIYPNPALNQFKIESNEIIESILIMNNLGQIILSLNDLDSNLKIINIDHLSKGIYLLKVNTNSKTITQQLIKQ